MAILHEIVLCHRKIRADESDTLQNINLNIPARSVKGILLLFEDPAASNVRDTKAFYNPKIAIWVSVVTNQLYSQEMHACQQWDKARN